VKNDRIPLDVLRRIPAFRQLNDSECHQLVEIALEKTYLPGEKVLEQGKCSQYLWILCDGQCQVMRESPRHGAVVLAELEPHSLFGEMSFFSPAPHSANVVAKTPVRLLCIARADYDDLIRDHCGAAYKLAYNIVESLAARLRRMDEWVAQLATDGQHPADRPADEQATEWRRFRDKLFKTWYL
jgi:CRP-like cAMP-binding protein